MAANNKNTKVRSTKVKRWSIQSSRYSMVTMIVFVVLMGVIGTYLIASSHAATASGCAQSNLTSGSANHTCVKVLQSMLNNWFQNDGPQVPNSMWIKPP